MMGDTVQSETCLNCIHGGISPKGKTVYCKAFKTSYTITATIGKCVYYSPVKPLDEVIVLPESTKR